MKTVFLGGTCNGSMWRDELIPKLQGINAYNPVVPDWTPECQAEEIRQRETCDYCLYVITPKMMGVYSIAEVVDDSNKRPEKTLFHIIRNDGETFSHGQMRSLNQTAKMVQANGGQYFGEMADLVAFLNEEPRPYDERRDEAFGR